MKNIIWITLLSIVYYLTPFLFATLALSGAITAIVASGFYTLSTAAGLFLFPFLISASVWALYRVTTMINQTIALRLAV